MRLLAACNRRYLEFISQLEAPTLSLKVLDKVTTSITVKGRTYRGFNFFLPDDRLLFETIFRGVYRMESNEPTA